MQDFFIGVVTVILLVVWIVVGVRRAHWAWRDEGGDKFLTFIFFPKSTFLYLLFYWIPIQFYLAYKDFQAGRQKKTYISNTTNYPNQRTTVSSSDYAKKIDTLMNADLIAMKTTQLVRIHQELSHMPPQTFNRSLLLSRIEEILKKRDRAGYGF